MEVEMFTTSVVIAATYLAVGVLEETYDFFLWQKQERLAGQDNDILPILVGVTLRILLWPWIQTPRKTRRASLAFSLLGAALLPATFFFLARQAWPKTEEQGKMSGPELLMQWGGSILSIAFGVGTEVLAILVVRWAFSFGQGLTGLVLVIVYMGFAMAMFLFFQIGRMEDNEFEAEMEEAEGWKRTEKSPPPPTKQLGPRHP